MHVQLLLINLLIVIAHIIAEDTISIENSSIVHEILNIRLESLKKFSKVTLKKKCNLDNLVVVTEYQFGNTGNHIIEFAHGVWFAERMNATLVVPVWMADIFVPFNTTNLSNSYCYTLNTNIPKNIKPYEVTSEESYFLFKLFHDKNYIKYLPNMDNNTIADLSLHFLKVYASLWSSPLSEIRSASEWVINNHLEGNFRYTSVHKRQMEGGCNKILAHVTKPRVDFSPTELPLDRAEWSGNLNRNHPLCSMSLELVLDTQTLHHRNGSKIFVAYDGAGDVDSYRKHGAVFSSVLEHQQYVPLVAPKIDGKAKAKFVDMFVAMHGDLFVLNPRSTFSWQIYLIRVCLALQSVPVVRTNDLFMQKLPEELVLGNRTMWVSWRSVVDAYLEHESIF
jgi:hypothetical protein